MFTQNLLLKPNKLTLEDGFVHSTDQWSIKLSQLMRLSLFLVINYFLKLFIILIASSELRSTNDYTKDFKNSFYRSIRMGREKSSFIGGAYW